MAPSASPRGVPAGVPPPARRAGLHVVGIHALGLVLLFVICASPAVACGAIERRLRIAQFASGFLINYLSSRKGKIRFSPLWKRGTSENFRSHQRFQISEKSPFAKGESFARTTP